jgi:predicted DNA-binding transcriptional regulator AlpA
MFDAELATVLNTSVKTIDRRMRAHTFPLQPLPAIDKRRRWSREEVRRYLAGETRSVRLVRRRA